MPEQEKSFRCYQCGPDAPISSLSCGETLCTYAELQEKIEAARQEMIRQLRG